jgi:hypothetical protein
MRLKAILPTGARRQFGAVVPFPVGKDACAKLVSQPGLAAFLSIDKSTDWSMSANSAITAKASSGDASTSLGPETFLNFRPETN